MAAEMHKMRNQLEQLQAELLFSRGGGASFEELQVTCFDYDLVPLIYLFIFLRNLHHLLLVKFVDYRYLFM